MNTVEISVRAGYTVIYCLAMALICVKCCYETIKIFKGE